MTPTTYPEFVASRTKPGSDILASLTPEMSHLWHIGSALMEEAAETYAPIGKHVVKNKPLDAAKIKKEAGDTLFFLVALCSHFGWTLEELQQSNREKLEARFPNGYSDADAHAKMDEQPAPTLPEWFTRLRAASPEITERARRNCEAVSNYLLGMRAADISGAFPWPDAPERGNFWLAVSRWLDGRSDGLPSTAHLPPLEERT